MTHSHDDIEHPSPRDYVDTKSWLAYERNPYSTQWIRSSSCHREMSLGYDIWLAIPQLQANTNIRLLHDATTPRCSDLRGCATLSCSVIVSMTRQHYHQHDSTSTSRHGQVTSAALLLAWLSSIVASMTRHLHHVMTMSPQQLRRQHDSAALSPAWFGIYIVSRPTSPQ
jgi:hypothetical protein